MVAAAAFVAALLLLGYVFPPYVVGAICVGRLEVDVILDNRLRARGQRAHAHEEGVEEAVRVDKGDDRNYCEDASELTKRRDLRAEKRQHSGERGDGSGEDGIRTREHGGARLEVARLHERILVGEGQVDEVVDGDADDDGECERFDRPKGRAHKVEHAHGDNDHAHDA